MFHFEAYKNMSLGKTGDCTRLILRDATGEVVFIAIDLTDNHYLLGKKGDDGFEEVLKSLELAKIEDGQVH